MLGILPSSVWIWPSLHSRGSRSENWLKSGNWFTDQDYLLSLSNIAFLSFVWEVFCLYRLNKKCCRLFIYFMPVNTMIDMSVPKVHMSHSTVKFTFPMLTITGCIMDTALSMLPIMITTIILSWTMQCYPGPLLPWGLAKPIAFNMSHWRAASTTLRSGKRKRVTRAGLKQQISQE